MVAQLPLNIRKFVGTISELTVDNVYNQYHLTLSTSASLRTERVREFQHGFENAWMVHWSKYHLEKIYVKEKFRANKKEFHVENFRHKHL